MKSILFIAISFLLATTLLANESLQRFPDNVMPSVVAIGLKDSLGVWQPWGTGFVMLSYKKTPQLLVTNRHIFAPEDVTGIKRKLSNVFVKVNIKQDDRLGIGVGVWTEFHLALLKDDTVLWTGHADDSVDIAVIYFPPLDTGNFILATMSNIRYIPKSLYEEIDSLYLGQEVLFFGFPLGLGTERNPRPVVRFGMIALIEPWQKSFYLDAQAFGGSSGSPVLMTGKSKGDRLKDPKRKLIGIISEFKPSPLHSVIYEPTIAGTKTDSIRVFVENSGLAKVFPTNLIMETIASHHERMGERYRKIMDSLGYR